MLAAMQALLLPGGGHLGAMGCNAGGVDGSGEGMWTLATPPEGFLAGVETGELAHLLHQCLMLAFPRHASMPGALPACRTPLRPTY